MTTDHQKDAPACNTCAKAFKNKEMSKCPTPIQPKNITPNYLAFLRFLFFCSTSMIVLHTELISKCKLATLKSYKADVSSINPSYFALTKG